LYRSSIWRLHWSTTCWLSPTPETPSKGWDAASPRIVTTGLFEHRATGRRVLALNTHLDDQGRKARVEGAKLILRWIQDHLDSLRLAAGGNGQVDVFLTGDLNSETSGFDAYTIFNHASSPVRDVRDLVPEDQWYGHWDTFTGFDDGESEPKKRIDFIFVGKEGARWMPVMYGVLGNRARGLYVSDHRAVVADALLGAGNVDI
jgi:endonuclease/exonuclease/phosphatase family metal-dependent hydrolase